MRYQLRYVRARRLKAAPVRPRLYIEQGRDSIAT
jgi:hypothetical protein